MKLKRHTLTYGIYYCRYWMMEGLLITRAERLEGLDSVVRMSNFNWTEVASFLDSYKNLGRPARTPNLRSAEQVFEVLIELFGRREPMQAKP